jgi:hypothetical protein
LKGNAEVPQPYGSNHRAILRLASESRGSPALTIETSIVPHRYINVAMRKKECCNALAGYFGGTHMASAKLLRRQAARCAGLAKQTHDEESRQRCERLEQTYLHLAEVEEQQFAAMNAPPGKSESKSAA